MMMHGCRAGPLEGRGVWHAVSLSAAQQVLGPLRARADARLALHVPGSIPQVCGAFLSPASFLLVTACCGCEQCQSGPQQHPRVCWAALPPASFLLIPASCGCERCQSGLQQHPTLVMCSFASCLPLAGCSMLLLWIMSAACFYPLFTLFPFSCAAYRHNPHCQGEISSPRDLYQCSIPDYAKLQPSLSIRDLLCQAELDESQILGLHR